VESKKEKQKNQKTSPKPKTTTVTKPTINPELIDKAGWWLPETRGWGWAQWVKGFKRYKFPIIKKSWGYNVQHGEYR